ARVCAARGGHNEIEEEEDNTRLKQRGYEWKRMCICWCWRWWRWSKSKRSCRSLNLMITQGRQTFDQRILRAVRVAPDKRRPPAGMPLRKRSGAARQVRDATVDY